ncbi:hypothetical protein [Streptomyces milbemycinicus]|uniref:Uncharacterized protein n=1 Tax=Streptomyces milbemycinicus TaxID=476552 RepID=A0ABW8M002_9ACTN
MNRPDFDLSTLRSWISWRDTGGTAESVSGSWPVPMPPIGCWLPASALPFCAECDYNLRARWEDVVTAAEPLLTHGAG